MSKNLTEKRLTPKQRLAVEALAMGRSVTQVAREVGVSRETIYRWRAQPVFLAELRRLGAEALERTTRQLTTLSEVAAVVLADGMHQGQPINARLRAAGLVLENAQKWTELLDIVSRLEEIEEEVRRERE